MAALRRKKRRWQRVKLKRKDNGCLEPQIVGKTFYVEKIPEWPQLFASCLQVRPGMWQVFLGEALQFFNEFAYEVEPVPYAVWTDPQWEGMR